MKKTYLSNKIESKNPFSPNYDTKFRVRVRNPIGKEDKTSNRNTRNNVFC